MNIQKLPKEFIGKGEVGGFLFVQTNETNDMYEYTVSIDGDVTHKEVFKKKTAPICVDFENKIWSETECKELYPKSKDFGQWAWTKKI